MSRGKIIEFERYEKRAKNFRNYKKDYISSLKFYYKKPYYHFIKLIKESILEGDNVLEIGAGFGQWTNYIIECNANLIASDISPESLKIIKKSHSNNKNLKTKIVDMENIPFPDNFFDFVVAAGSLSYGNNIKCMNEFYRVLKPGGYFICVDSLNNNPIYILNRIINILKTKRSLFTLNNMPNQKTINQYRKLFQYSEISYFGILTFLGPLFDFKFLRKIYNVMSNYIDSIKILNSFAFKFTMIVRK